jgi:hypothetical protein
MNEPADLPLDETALQAAHETFRTMLRAQRGDSWDDLVDAAISTYLREARFEVICETNDYRAKLPYPVVGPWKLIPLVQAESEEE